jgi:hypothetical protein
MPRFEEEFLSKKEEVEEDDDEEESEKDEDEVDVTVNGEDWDLEVHDCEQDIHDRIFALLKWSERNVLPHLVSEGPGRKVKLERIAELVKFAGGGFNLWRADLKE